MTGETRRKSQTSRYLKMRRIWKALKNVTISVVHTYNFRQLEWKNHLL